MNTFNSKMILPLVASLSLGMSFSTQASAQTPNADQAASDNRASVAQFYIPQSHCTDEVGVRNASAPDIRTLSAQTSRCPPNKNSWTATLPGTTMIERIEFSNASHLKDAVVTIEDPDLRRKNAWFSPVNL